MFFSDEWYCSTSCQLGEESDDNVLQYSKALMSTGLAHLTRRDAVREGDGEAVISDWKLDMLQFWINGHYKYFIIGHLLLASEFP